MDTLILLPQGVQVSQWGAAQLQPQAPQSPLQFQGVQGSVKFLTRGPGEPSSSLWVDLNKQINHLFKQTNKNNFNYGSMRAVIHFNKEPVHTSPREL